MEQPTTVSDLQYVMLWLWCHVRVMVS